MIVRDSNRSRTVLTASLVAVLTGVLILITTDSGHGLQEQAKVPVTRTLVGTPEFGARGDFQGRLLLQGQGQIELERVLEISLRRDWAILRFLEEADGKIATLMVPREAVGFAKIWEDIPEEK